MILSKNYEDLLKYVSSVEVRAMIRRRIKTLIKDIEKTYKLSNELGWKWRMDRERKKKRKELYEIEIQLINHYNKLLPYRACASSLSSSLYQFSQS